MVMQIAEIFPWAEKPLAKWILGVDPSSPGVVIHYGDGGSDSGGEGGNGTDPGGGGGGEKSREEAGASGKTLAWISPGTGNVYTGFPFVGFDAQPWELAPEEMFFPDAFINKPWTDCYGAPRPWKEHTIPAHHGIDFGTNWKANQSMDLNIYAVMGGKITYADYSNSKGGTEVDGTGLGFVVVIENNGFQTVYAHLDAFKNYKVGDIVPAGGAIGIMGESGGAYGVHLHYEVRKCAQDEEGVVRCKHVDPNNTLLPGQNSLVDWYKSDKMIDWAGHNLCYYCGSNYDSIQVVKCP